MNTVLSFLNAAALIALVAFHFQGNGNETEQVHTNAQAEHVMHQPAQFAVMHQHQESQAMLANDSVETDGTPITRSERWVF